MPHRDWKVIGDFLVANGATPDLVAKAVEKQVEMEKKRGVHFPLGYILRQSKMITPDAIADAVRSLEEYRLAHLDPITQFSPSTKFGERLFEHVVEKKQVAELTARRFLRPESCVFIADGTSGFYTFLAVARDIAPTGLPQVKTNSLAIAMEYSQNATVAQHMRLELVGREPVNTKERNEYLALGGDSSDREVRDACKGITAMLPVTAISYDEGPCARGDRIRRIKLAIMESAARVIFIVDHTKLNKTKRQRSDEKQDPIYEDPKQWQSWREKALWHLITTIDPRIRVVNVPPGTELQWTQRGDRQFDNTNEELRQYAGEVEKFSQENEKAPGHFIEVIPVEIK